MGGVRVKGEHGFDGNTGSEARDPRIAHSAIARRAFEISLTIDATPEENWALAEAELIAELAARSLPTKH